MKWFVFAGAERGRGGQFLLKSGNSPEATEDVINVLTS